MQRSHEMPFGAALLPGGGVRFRLWAPAAKQVHLLLEGREEIPMARLKEGWYGLDTAEAGVGSRYRFRIDNGKMAVPDPASRFQPEDVHGPSEVIDPAAFAWSDSQWLGRPWEEAVVYELHVGSFTPAGTFRGVMEKLDYLVALGVTTIELMPVGDFPGQRNWGYDGVYSFAPDTRYGRPEDLKALVQTAHEKGLMIFLDVVYNHFGPEGNYLHRYAPQFFTELHHTLWGAAINFDGRDSYWVRQFFIHNALYWLEEYHFDGLRFDAVHAIFDDSAPHILEELAEEVRNGRLADRRIHLVLENDNNAAHFLARTNGQPRWYDAQWNDDIHHAFHVIATGEDGGYYQDYAERPLAHLGRCLSEGFAYQGERSNYRHGARRGESTAGLPPTAFVAFLQNHDQVGNRAFGERLTTLTSPEALRSATAVILLAPSPPLLFMGQEWGCAQPFPFFCDFGSGLAEAVTEGRRREFARFPEFADPKARERIPDPSAAETFEAARLAWQSTQEREAQAWLTLHRELLALRHTAIAPCLAAGTVQTGHHILASRALQAWWQFADGTKLLLTANLGTDPVALRQPVEGEAIYSLPAEAAAQEVLPPWSVQWHLSRGEVA